MVNLKLASILPSSTVDWRGKVVAILFLRGCDFRCPYCHNYPLLEPGDVMSAGDVEELLRRDFKFLDGIVLSGGEPLLQPEGVAYLCRLAEKLGLACGLQTNGNHPDELANLLNANMIDALFIDVKAPLRQVPYRMVSGLDDVGVVSRIKESINRGIRARSDGKLEYMEVRTTIFPGVTDTPAEIDEIAREVGGVDRFVLQQGRPENAPETFSRGGETTSRDELFSLATVAKRRLPAVGIRSRKGGEEDV